MARIAKNKKSCRLNLEMSPVVRKNLEQLRDDTNADSLAEVVRRSLAVYEFVCKAHKQNAKLICRFKDGKESEVLPLL